jgi:hypothetical protein
MEHARISSEVARNHLKMANDMRERRQSSQPQDLCSYHAAKPSQKRQRAANVVPQRSCNRGRPHLGEFHGDADGGKGGKSG